MDNLADKSPQEELDNKITQLTDEAIVLGIQIPQSFNILTPKEKIDSLTSLIEDRRKADAMNGATDDGGGEGESEDGEEESNESAPGDPEIQITREVINNVLNGFSDIDIAEKAVKEYIKKFEILIGKSGEVPNKIEINREEREIKIEAGSSYDEIKKAFFDIYSKRAEDPQVPAGPDFQGEEESAEKSFDLSQIDQEIQSKLTAHRITIDIQDASLYPVVFHDLDKKILIRKDADPNDVNNYIRENVLSSLPPIEEKGVEDSEKKDEFQKPIETGVSTSLDTAGAGLEEGISQAVENLKRRGFEIPLGSNDEAFEQWKEAILKINSVFEDLDIKKSDVPFNRISDSVYPKSIIVSDYPGVGALFQAGRNADEKLMKDFLIHIRDKKIVPTSEQAYTVAEYAEEVGYKPEARLQNGKEVKVGSKIRFTDSATAVEYEALVLDIDLSLEGEVIIYAKSEGNRKTYVYLSEVNDVIDDGENKTDMTNGTGKVNIIGETNKKENEGIPQEFSSLKEMCQLANIDVVVQGVKGDINYPILTPEEIKNISSRVQEALRNKFTPEQLNEIHQKGINRIILDSDNTGIKILTIGGDLYIDRNAEISEIVSYIKENILGVQPEIQTQGGVQDPNVNQEGQRAEKFKGRDGVELKVDDMVEWETYGGAIKKGKIIDFSELTNGLLFAVVNVYDEEGTIVENTSINLSRLSLAKKDLTGNPAAVPPLSPTDTTPKPPKDTSSRIQFAEGKNKEQLAVYDMVSWISRDGSLNTGSISGFRSDVFGTEALIIPDSDSGTEVAVPVNELSLFDEKKMPKGGTSVPPASPPPPAPKTPPPPPQVPPVVPLATPSIDPKTGKITSPEPLKKAEKLMSKTKAQFLRERYLTPEENTRLSEIRAKIFKLKKEGKDKDENGTTLATLEGDLDHYLNELNSPADPSKHSLSSRIKASYYAEARRSPDEIEILTKKALFEIMVRGEQEEEMKMLRESRRSGRGGNLIEGTKEVLSNIVGTKAISWYLKQSKTKRFLINAAVIGTAIGGFSLFSTGSAGIAAGVAGLRTARAAASFIGGNAGAVGGEWLGKKVTGISGFASKNEKELDKEKEVIIKNIKADGSLGKKEKLEEIEKIERLVNKRKKDIWDEWYKKEEEKIWQSGKDRKKMTEDLTNLEKQYKKKKRVVAGATMLGALVGGVSGALASDMTLPSKPTVGPSPNRGAAPSSDQRVSGPNQRPGAGQSPVKPMPAPAGTPAPTEPVKPATASQAPKIERIHGISPEKAQFVPKQGSTLWGGVGEILENNPKYKALSPEGKEFIQSTYLNKIIENREALGLEADTDYGVKLEVGQKVDMSEVFKDTSEFDKLIERAENLSSKQKDNIRLNDERIANWIKANPGKKASIAELDKLLSGKHVSEDGVSLAAGPKEFTPPNTAEDSLKKGARVYYDYDNGPQIDYSGNTVGNKALADMGSEFDNVKKGIDDLANQQDRIEEKIANIKSPVINDPAQINISQPENWSQKIININDDLKRLYEQRRELNDRLLKAMTPRDNSPVIPRGEIDRISSELSVVEKQTDALEDEVQRIIKESNAAEENILNNKAPNDGTASMGGSAVAAAAIAKIYSDGQKSPETLKSEIEAAKLRLEELENGASNRASNREGENAIDRNSEANPNQKSPTLIRTFVSDTRDFEERKIVEDRKAIENANKNNPNNVVSISKSPLYKGLNEKEMKIQSTFENGIDSIFGSGGFLGSRIGKKPGIESTAWKFIKGLTYEDVLKYFKDNSAEAFEEDKVLKELGESKNTTKYIDLMKEIVELEGVLRQRNKNISLHPYKMEMGKRVNLTVEQYLRSLVEAVVNTDVQSSTTNLKRA